MFHKFHKIAKSIPVLVGLLLLYSGAFKLFSPGEAVYSVMALDFSPKSATVIMVLVTASEIYLAMLLITRTDLKYSLSAAAGLIGLFTAFLWFLSTLAHPPSCGCMGLTGIFTTGKEKAVFGIFRNCIILWAMKVSYDACCLPESTSGSVERDLDTFSPLSDKR